MHLYSFEKLEVWQDSRHLTVLIYKLSGEFPDQEKFGLTNQIRRAAVSITSNIAEGSGRTHAKDKAHFFQISYSSCLEVLSQLIIAHDLGFVKSNDVETGRLHIEKLTNKLNSLRRSVLNESPEKK